VARNRSCVWLTQMIYLRLTSGVYLTVLIYAKFTGAPAAPKQLEDQNLAFLRWFFVLKWRRSLDPYHLGLHSPKSIDSPKPRSKALNSTEKSNQNMGRVHVLRWYDAQDHSFIPVKHGQLGPNRPYFTGPFWPLKISSLLAGELPR
jgi:hypothetical protein